MRDHIGNRHSINVIPLLLERVFQAVTTRKVERLLIVAPSLNIIHK
jgi:hypothetical protein